MSPRFDLNHEIGLARSLAVNQHASLFKKNDFQEFHVALLTNFLLRRRCPTSFGFRPASVSNSPSVLPTSGSHTLSSGRSQENSPECTSCPGFPGSNPLAFPAPREEFSPRMLLDWQYLFCSDATIMGRQSVCYPARTRRFSIRLYPSTPDSSGR